MSQNNQYEILRKWIYRNARPLDLARWQYHFEGGTKEAVLNALSSYQNEDGGFGHALEADAWNPYSAPIQVFHAIDILREIGFTEAEHPIMKGILSYLASGKDMEGNLWLSNIPSNNEYPHASWWEFSHPYSNHNRYNPTAGLAGFGLCYGEKNSELFERCSRIVQEACGYLLQATEVDMHTMNCFIALMEYCEQANITEVIDLGAMRKKLMELVQGAITKDTGIWATSYVCKPSQFFKSPDSIFYPDNKEIADYECQFIQDSRNQEGVWDVTWSWEAYPEEWAIAKLWWKSEIVIKNMRYLKNFNIL
ncbi:MAG: hypothetical protein K0R34_1309 [Herbinix sp.]|jgi:hypothetical protein|nr:hypothetical protein [Herbinix sp.]